MLCVVLFFGIVDLVLGVVQRLGLFEHFMLMRVGAWIFFLAVVGWFGWRLYTGLERDGDFWIEE